MTNNGPVRRFEIFTGAGRRRSWSAEDKARIVAESYSGLESVCAVARRHGLAQGQLFTWRREVREKAAALVAPGQLEFAPVVVEPAAAAAKPAPRMKRRRSRRSDGGIELEIDGVVVRVGRGAEAKTVAAVIRALKAER